MVIQEPERQSSYLALVGVELGESRLDRVGLEIKDSVCLVKILFRSIVKLDSVVCSSSQHTHLFKFHVLVFGFLV